MAAKPSNTYAWNTGAANRTEPNAGKKVLGWIRGEKPSSSTFNWLLNGAYQWFAYLSDGAFTGNHSIAGNLTVTGTISGGTAEREFNLSGKDFEFESQADPLTDTLNHPGLYRHNAGGLGYALARVPVLVGDVITLCTVFYNPNGGGNMQPKLKRIKLSDGTVTDVWAGVADNTGVAIESQTSGAITHTVLAGESYFVEVLHNGVANRTHGATIKYTRPAP